jgi:hypothetical protein
MLTFHVHFYYFTFLSSSKVLLSFTHSYRCSSKSTYHFHRLQNHIILWNYSSCFETNKKHFRKILLSYPFLAFLWFLLKCDFQFRLSFTRVALLSLLAHTHTHTKRKFMLGVFVRDKSPTFHFLVWLVSELTKEYFFYLNRNGSDD